MTLIYIVLLTLIGSVISLLGGLVLLMRKSWNTSFCLRLTSFASGVLLATAFLDLFPEAMELIAHTGHGNIFLPAFSGIVLFFLLERGFIWFHHHHDHHGAQPTVWMIIIGDGLHNFIDGVAISAAFILNPVLGFMTTIAVSAHEIPQEIADFSILLSHGMSKRRAVLLNIASAMTAIVGAVGMYAFADHLHTYLGSIISFTAGMFVYIALSDLIPELHHSQSDQDNIPQIIVFLIGVMIVGLMVFLVGDFAHPE